jgi:hypothetical protein
LYGTDVQHTLANRIATTTDCWHFADNEGALSHTYKQRSHQPNYLMLPSQILPGQMAGRWQQWLPLLLAINALLLCEHLAVSTAAAAVQGANQRSTAMIHMFVC